MILHYDAASAPSNLTTRNDGYSPMAMAKRAILQSCHQQSRHGTLGTFRGRHIMTTIIEYIVFRMLTARGAVIG